MKLETVKFEVVGNPKRPKEKSIGILTLNRPATRSSSPSGSATAPMWSGGKT